MNRQSKSINSKPKQKITVSDQNKKEGYEHSPKAKKLDLRQLELESYASYS